MKRYIPILILAVWLAWPAASMAQCAMCRASVESNVASQESQVGAGLNTGILYLMAIPYILIGTVGFFWYRHSRQYRKRQQAANL